MSEDKKKDRIVPVTGASSYVGGWMVPALEGRKERGPKGVCAPGNNITV